MRFAASIVLEVELHCGAGGPAVVCEATVVLLDADQGRPAALDEGLRSRLTPFVGPPVPLRPPVTRLASGSS